MASGKIVERLVRPSPSNAYIFVMLALVFGLPLLTAYYNVNPSFYFLVLIPYLAITIFLSIFLILSSQRPRKKLSEPQRMTFEIPSSSSNGIRRFNSMSLFVPASLVALTAIIFLVVSSFASSAYPSVLPLGLVDTLGAAYIIPLIITSIVVSSRVIYWAFPALREILKERKYTLLAMGLAISFAFVYFILVNQIIISGYNVEGTAPAFGMGYPSWFAMVPGVNNFMIYLVYLPTLIVQISPAINLIIIPFEMLFATILSLLVASNVVMAHYLISHSGLACSTKGAAISAGGSILGLSATCPTCLVPTFVSVAFGGVSATVLSFSNFNGVVLPPILSVAALILSAFYLQKEIKRRSANGIISTGRLGLE